MSPLNLCLLLACALFSLGLAGALCRSHAILVLLGVELMLNAANLSFIAFWRFGAAADPAEGLVFVIFSIAVAAAEAAVGLAIVLSINRHRGTARLEAPARLKG